VIEPEFHAGGSAEDSGSLVDRQRFQLACGSAKDSGSLVDWQKIPTRWWLGENSSYWIGTGDSTGFCSCPSAPEWVSPQRHHWSEGGRMG
jgi:hypothetical protein